MNQSKTVNTLTEDLKPIYVFRISSEKILLCLFSGFFSILAGLTLSGIRFDLLAVISTPRFWIESVSLIVLAVLSTIVSLQMSIPGTPLTRLKFLTSFAGALWILTGIYFFLNQSSSLVFDGFRCTSQVFLGALIPAAFIFFITSKGAALKRRHLGYTAVIAGTSYGAVIAQLSCAITDSTHLLVWHVLPVFCIGLIGLVIGQSVLKKI